MTSPGVTLHIKADASGVAAGAKVTSDHLAKIGASAGNAGAALRGMGKSGVDAGDQVSAGAKKGAEGLRQTVREAAQAQLSIKSIVQSAASLAGIAIGANLVRSAVQMADSYTNLSSKIRNVADDESALARVREQAFRIAQDTRQVLSATGELYANLTRSTEALGLSESQRLRITETINKSLVVSGATAQAASAAIVQLGQGMQSGALRGDEFNSVAEQAPILLDLLARSLGVARGELRGMAEDGLITADVLATALLEGSAEVDRQFANMAITVSGSVVQLVNAVERWVGSSSDGIGATALLAESISLVARNIDPLANLIVGLSLAWSAKYVVGLVAAKAASVAQIQANIQLAASELALAQAAEVAAAAQVREALTLNGTRVATEALAAAQARTAAATNALTAAQAANAGLMARAGSGLLAMAGGPVGVLVLGLGALVGATFSAIQAEEERQQQFDAAMDAADQLAMKNHALVESIRAVSEAVPPTIAERINQQTEATTALIQKQGELEQARKRLNVVIWDALGLQGTLAELQERIASGDAPHWAVDAYEDYVRLDGVTSRLSAAVRDLADANEGALAPAIDVVRQRFAALTAEADGGFFANIGSYVRGAAEALLAGSAKADDMATAYKDAQAIAASLSATATKAAEDLATLGQSGAERAAEQVALWEEQARASGAFTDAQIAAQKAALDQSVAAISALEREKEAIKGRSQALRDSKTAQREQVRAWDDALRASSKFQDRLEELRAETAGPLAQAQAKYQRQLREITDDARLAGISTSELAEAQAHLRIAFESDVMASFKEQLRDIKDASKDVGRSWKDVLNELADTPLSRLIDDIELVGKALENATDPEHVKELQDALGQLRGMMHEGMIDTSIEALRSLQSMSEGGSEAFRAMQVAIDALTLVQAISAVLNQGNGDPYTAFARMAAMAAAVASLGVSVGGLAGGFGDVAQARQDAQGTGSVLGDTTADSASIARAVEITADATSELVGINRGMLNALTAMQAGLTGASTLLARGAGDVDFAAVGAAPLNATTQVLNSIGNVLTAGLFGGLLNSISRSILGARSKVTDTGLLIGGGTLSALLEGLTVGAYQEVSSRSWWFGSTHTNTDVQALGDDVAAQFQLVLDSMANAVRSGAEALGLNMEEVNAAIAAYHIEEIRISTMDLSPEEAQAELEAVFGKIFDDLARDIVPFIPQFQQIGEGLGETLVRVATGVQVTREAIDRLGFALEASGPEQFAQFSEALIELMGGIDNFISGMTSFIDAFAPEAHKFELLQNDLTRAFAEVGLVVPQTRDGMWQLMQSLDASTESGRAQIATLLRLAETADEYYGVLEQRAQALADANAEYARTVDSLRDELADAGGGMSDFAIAMRDIDRWSQEARDALHAAALATGRQSAAEEDLALVHQIAAQRAAAAIERLRASAAALVVELYGTPLDQVEAEIQRIEAAHSASVDSQVSGINAVGDAAQRVYDAQLAALQGIQAWLDSQRLGDLSTLTSEQQLAEAQRQFDVLLAAANAGDVDALQGITSQADVLLRLGRAEHASSEQYTQLEAMVRSSLQALVDAGPRASQSTAGATTTGGYYSGGSSSSGINNSELQDLYARRDELLNQQMVEQRAAMLRELGMMVRELIAATERPLDVVAEMIGLNLTRLAEDLGVNLQDLGIETAVGLSDMARQLGVDVAELASNVGVELGALGDRQSLLNQALDRTLESIPAEFRDQLSGSLDAIRNATTEADATSAVNAAEEAILGMPEGIRDLLAPFFSGIDPSPVVTELTTLRTLASTADAQLVELSAIRTAIEAIGRSDGAQPLPSYDVGTGYVPTTGPALIHAGEMIVPASVNAWAQRNGLTIGPSSQGGANDGVIRELRTLREQQQRAAEEMAIRLARVEQAQRDGAERIARETQRQTDVIATGGR